MAIHELNKVMEKLGKLSGETDAIQARLNNQDKRLSDQDKHILSLQKRQAWFLGILIIVGVCLTFISTIAISQFQLSLF